MFCVLRRFFDLILWPRGGVPPFVSLTLVHVSCFIVSGIQLKGSINDCSCTVDTVDYFNNNKVFPRLRSLLLKDYFRFYRVNLRKQCPFWEDTSKCAMRFCSVSPCADSDIPQGLRETHDGDAAAASAGDDAIFGTVEFDEKPSAAAAYMKVTITCVELFVVFEYTFMCIAVSLSQFVIQMFCFIFLTHIEYLFMVYYNKMQ